MSSKCVSIGSKHTASSTGVIVARGVVVRKVRVISYGWRTFNPVPTMKIQVWKIYLDVDKQYYCVDEMTRFFLGF